jgi:carboxylesterase type B
VEASSSVQYVDDSLVFPVIFHSDLILFQSDLKVYDGRNFVRDNDDLIFVTFNYRINMFGQPNAPQLVSSTNSQNFGLLDIKAAIDWVKNNIAQFGGDPNRISIFGHSAGATAADIYAQSYPTDTTVKGALFK